MLIFLPEKRFSARVFTDCAIPQRARFCSHPVAPLQAGSLSSILHQLQNKHVKSKVIVCASLANTHIILQIDWQIHPPLRRMLVYTPG